MPQHQHEREVPRPVPDVPRIVQEVVNDMRSKIMDIPEIVGLHIAEVMKDSTKMREMENDLDQYIKTLTPEERLAQRETIRRQLTTGSKVCESILNRYLSS